MISILVKIKMIQTDTNFAEIVISTYEKVIFSITLSIRILKILFFYDSIY